MSDAEMLVIEARVNAASPEPWRTGRKVFRTLYSEEHLMGMLDSPRDAAFVANARTDIPVLIAEIKRLKAEVAFLGERVTEIDTLKNQIFQEVVKLRGEP